MSDPADNEILVVPAASHAPIPGQKGIFDGKGAAAFVSAPVKLNVAALSGSLQEFIDSLNAMVARLPAKAGAYHLEEIELSVEINAEGGFQLIGGAKAGVTGGLTLTLKRD